MKKFDQRKADRHAEQQLAQFLDKYFYDVLNKNDSTFKFIRVNSIEQQLQGIDMILSEESRNLYFDEKAALHYINQNLTTFSFEINFVNRANKIHEGWLNDDDLSTTHYVLIWVTANRDFEKHELINISEEDFVKLEIYIINRKKLQTYLNELDLTPDKLMSEANSFRKAYDTIENQKQNILENDKICYLFLTNKLPERPVNLLLRKRILKNLADRKYIITREKLTKLS